VVIAAAASVTDVVCSIADATPTHSRVLSSIAMADRLEGQDKAGVVL
jgi:hypothetical protein